jgi:type II secretory pathway pseudopilin PulG
VRNEEGFSLLEVVLAAGVMAFVLATLAYASTAAFADAAVARHRQTASSLVNQAIEQTRALPYNTVALGLSTTDLQSGSDPDVTAVAGAYYYDGERIPNGNNANVTPLVPHASTVTVDRLGYTVRVYVTYLDDDPLSRALRITATASWTSSLRRGTNTFVSAQTIIYSPGGSASNATHPFSAPVQPFLYATSEVSEGGVTISGYNGGAGVSGINLGQAAIWLPTESSYMQVEQISAVTAKAITSGVSMRSSGSAATVSGRQEIIAASDSDPSQPKPVTDTKSVGTGATAQTSSTLTLDGGTYGISVTSASDDTATATSTVSSTASAACADLDGTVLVDELPCATATTRMGSSVNAVLDAGSLGDAELASMTPAAADGGAHTNRDVAPQSGSCTSTTGDGCIRSTHAQRIGSVRLAALPASVAALAPLGFTHMVKLDNISRRVTAEAGIGNANPSVTDYTGGSSMGTISYWNGVAYTTVNITAGSASASLSLGTVTVTNALTSTTISLGGVIRTGTATAAACASPCSAATAQSESPVVGDLRYTVVVGGVTVVDLALHIDLGTLLAEAEYTPGA